MSSDYAEEPATLAFVDVETSGLDITKHVLWEIGLVLVAPDGTRGEWEWIMPLESLPLALADPKALEVNRYHERVAGVELVIPYMAASMVARFTKNTYLVGAIPSFDALFLTKFLQAHGQVPQWRHRLLCVESYAAGAFGWTHPVGLRITAERLGVPYDPATHHSAMADARLAEQVYLVAQAANLGCLEPQ